MIKRCDSLVISQTRGGTLHNMRLSGALHRNRMTPIPIRGTSDSRGTLCLFHKKFIVV